MVQVTIYGYKVVFITTLDGNGRHRPLFTSFISQSNEASWKQLFDKFAEYVSVPRGFASRAFTTLRRRGAQNALADRPKLFAVTTDLEKAIDGGLKASALRCSTVRINCLLHSFWSIYVRVALVPLRLNASARRSSHDTPRRCVSAKVRRRRHVRQSCRQGLEKLVAVRRWAKGLRRRGGSHAAGLQTFCSSYRCYQGPGPGARQSSLQETRFVRTCKLFVTLWLTNPVPFAHPANHPCNSTVHTQVYEQRAHGRNRATDERDEVLGLRR